MDINEEKDMIEETDHEEESVVLDQPIFVCHTVIDVNSQQEASEAAIGKKSRGANWVMYGMCLLMGGYLVADSIINSHWQQNAIMLILVAAIAVFTVFSRNGTQKKALERWEEAIIKKYGSPALHVTTEFYKLSLAQTIKEDEEQFVGDGYSSILEMLETENLFMLRHGKNQYYFVAKNGFVRGTAEEFRTFIKERMGGK